MNFWQSLPRPFFALAPMEAVTDVVFRQVVAKAARPDVFFTEFTNATSFCHPDGRERTASRLAFLPSEQPVVAQIWGTDPEHFARMAVELKQMNFAGIDINMGCPDATITKRGACSALIENPPLATELIAAAKEGGLPVSVKTRAGFQTQKTEEWISFLLQQDLAALTVHGRTAKEMSRVPARWEEITKARQLRDSIAPQTIIIGNGDVENRQEGLVRAEQTSADGIMIGRGVFHNPFCFEIDAKEHTQAERAQLLHEHLDLFDQTWQDNKYYAPLKRFFKIYINDFHNAGNIRAELMETTTTKEAREVLARHSM
jgi:tRNA-dihydrouridine synthase